ncbi:unknown [Clostridium sp. CAG:349]|nr:unknown [Clostridium sp. CAG:349]
MEEYIKIIVYIFAGIGTGFAALSAAALIANKVKPKTLNITVGVVLLILGIVMFVLHSFF